MDKFNNPDKLQQHRTEKDIPLRLEFEEEEEDDFTTFDDEEEEE
jgi:hypothetical protein